MIEPELEEARGAVEAHGMDPVKVLALARQLGGRAAARAGGRLRAATRMTGDERRDRVELSEPVRAALDGRRSRWSRSCWS